MEKREKEKTFYFQHILLENKLFFLNCGFISNSSKWNENLYLSVITLLYMILPQVHLRKPCYDFSFL